MYPSPIVTLISRPWDRCYFTPAIGVDDVMADSASKHPHLHVESTNFQPQRTNNLVLLYQPHDAQSPGRQALGMIIYSCQEPGTVWTRGKMAPACSAARRGLYCLEVAD
jgi:hypothetical protein